MTEYQHILNGLDAASAQVLQATLLTQRGIPIVVDGSQVEAGGTPGLQVLLSAAKTWEADSVEFSVVNASQPFLEALQLLGIAGNQLNLKPRSS